MPDLIHQTTVEREPDTNSIGATVSISANQSGNLATVEHPAVEQQAEATTLGSSSWRFWGGALFAVVIAIAFLFVQMESFVNPLPNIPECAACSSLKESLSAIALRWETAALSAEDLAAELDSLESAVSKQTPAATRPSREAGCLNALISAMDQRLNEYSRNTLERLTGFGSDDACPKLQELLSLSVRLKSLIKQTQHSLEKPTCEELLQWHSQFYSCSR